MQMHCSIHVFFSFSWNLLTRQEKIDLKSRHSLLIPETFLPSAQALLQPLPQAEGFQTVYLESAWFHLPRAGFVFNLILRKSDLMITKSLEIEAALPANISPVNVNRLKTKSNSFWISFFPSLSLYPLFLSSPSFLCLTERQFIFSIHTGASQIIFSPECIIVPCAKEGSMGLCVHVHPCACCVSMHTEMSACVRKFVCL